MQYRKDKYGNDISILGYGCMRFTRKGKNIDFEKAEAEVLHGKIIARTIFVNK